MLLLSAFYLIHDEYHVAHKVKKPVDTAVMQQA